MLPQVIEVSAVESPRAPPAALSQRLSQKARSKTEQEVAGSMQAASDKREAVLQARVERAQEMRTPRGGQSSMVDISDADAPAAAAPSAPPLAAPPSTPLTLGPDGTPVMPKLKLNMNVPSKAEEGLSATPRSTCALDPCSPAALTSARPPTQERVLPLNPDGPPLPLAGLPFPLDGSPLPLLPLPLDGLLLPFHGLPLPLDGLALPLDGSRPTVDDYCAPRLLLLRRIGSGASPLCSALHLVCPPLRPALPHPARSYSKASSDAKAAVADSRAGGKGSARSMLRQHVANMDYSGLGDDDT